MNVAQIADGALGTSQAVLQRMRTLVVQAANSGTQGTSSLASIQQELGSLSTQLDNVSTQTSFGGTEPARRRTTTARSRSAPTAARSSRST